MRTVDVRRIAEAVSRLCIEANHQLGADHIQALRRGLRAERSPIGCRVLQGLLDNATIAGEGLVPFCQDTGYAVIYLEIGQDVHLSGGDLRCAVDAGVADGWRRGFLRPSLIRGPLDRRNTGDNTPAVLHTSVIPGSEVGVTVLIKGAGCDNMSAIRMLTPADDIDSVVEFVVEVVERAGPNASPPLTIGVGIGGTFDRAAHVANRALCRTSGEPNSDPAIAALEQRILLAVNDTGIGPAGFGGVVTALAVHVESTPTHIAAFPVAVNLDCHSHRVRQTIL